MLNLQSLREAAGFSGPEMATLVGCAESDITIYEADAQAAPFWVVRQWLEHCGTDFESAVTADQQEPSIDAGSPYQDLTRQLKLLVEYVEDAYPVGVDWKLPNLPTKSETLIRLEGVWRKPVVTLTGPFDAGKSRLANTLLSTTRIPSRYTPTTQVTTYIRHSADRPHWQGQDVLVLDRDFDPLRWRDAKHCSEHFQGEGGFDLLGQVNRRAAYALAYVNSPILNACTLVDLPGFDDKGQDEALALEAAKRTDVLFYLSNATGFLKQQDIMRLSQLVRVLPILRPSDPTLPNLFVVATHAHPAIKSSEVENILDYGARMLFEDLEETWASRGKAAGFTITADILRNCFYPFWNETRSRRQPLERALQQCLSQTLPPAMKKGISREMELIKQGPVTALRRQVKLFELAISDQERTRAEFECLDKGKPDRDARITILRQKTLASIRDHRKETQTFLNREIRPIFSEACLELFIRTNFTDKKRAQESVLTRTVERVQSKVDEFLSARADVLRKDVESYLSEFDFQFGSSAGKGEGIVTLAFDSKGVFAGTVAGLSTMGALGIVAATMGNLGGYILVAKGVSLLSALGLSVGGTAAASSFVAALGGPVTLALGLAALIGWGFWTLFSDAWQKRLAKRLAEVLRTQDFVGGIVCRCEQFWSATETGFSAASEIIERKYVDYIDQLRLQMTTASRSTLEGSIAEAEELRRFFGDLPWRYPA
jgi:Dynamin family